MADADVAVVGAGIVGCAVARRFALEGARVVLIERGADILSGASKANSAILHTGFDAPPDSLELACMREGRGEYLAIRDRFNLPLLETGAIVTAWTEAQEGQLDAIAAKAATNGVPVERLGKADLRRLEPGLGEAARAGLRVAGEDVIDPWSPALAYVLQAMTHGARVLRGEEVRAGHFDGALWHLTTSRRVLRARTVINCAGLYGDRLEQILLGHGSFEIRPRKGQFVVFDKAAAALLRHIILPVPTARTKGVVICRTAFGNVLVGPTAEEQEDRDHPATDAATLRALLAEAARMVPALAQVPVTATYAGLRPATEESAYRIRHEPLRNWITLGGIRSTGLTAALGLAAHAFRLYSGDGPAHDPVADPVWPRMPMLAEDGARDWQRPGYEEIVCHCEMVTRREIEAALASALPPGNLGGLRRRTRAAMGRCQGFNCLGRIAALTAGRLDPPLACGTGGEAGRGGDG
ncbi:NAD(P)/FAD-dependent oxidoreductase [Halodurantibacterium flavum]|uniref:NAD(P)/FAD-dependent oxidoreductase n=1 Tax=Halodurantibacterium flavum TaxID=1382802 RepID=A0ABW4S5Z5_9RHOB